jgi:hypothetical protein
LSDGTIVAVKHLIKSQQGVDDFLNEVIVITGVRHRNLVKLKGCCVHGTQRFLVFEYMENNNLAEALWGTLFLKYAFTILIKWIILLIKLKLSIESNFMSSSSHINQVHMFCVCRSTRATNFILGLAKTVKYMCGSCTWPCIPS